MSQLFSYFQCQNFGHITPHRVLEFLFSEKSNIIRAHWDDLLRLIATIKLKLTPASQIFNRLTSYAKQHTVYQALISDKSSKRSSF